jgi:hypothetical protein
MCEILKDLLHQRRENGELISNMLLYYQSTIWMLIQKNDRDMEENLNSEESDTSEKESGSDFNFLNIGTGGAHRK